MKILENAAVMFKQKLSQIIDCYGSEWQPLFTKMKEKISNIQFQKPSPSEKCFELSR
jgi:type II secretory pathway component PulJ